MTKEQNNNPLNNLSEDSQKTVQQIVEDLKNAIKNPKISPADEKRGIQNDSEKKQKDEDEKTR